MLGAEIIWNETVIGFSKSENNFIVKTNKRNFQSKYLVDATGYTANLTEIAGLRNQKPTNISQGYEYIIKSYKKEAQVFKNTFAFYVGKDLAPSGYAWVFDNGNDTYKIGIGDACINKNDNFPSLEKRTINFIEFLGIQNYEIIEKHGASKFLSNRIKIVTKDNFFAIGDTICALHPITGEGIRQGLITAESAFKAILNKKPSIYQSFWNSYNGKKRALIFAIANQFTENGKQEVFNILINIIKTNLNAQDLVELGFYDKMEIFIKKAPIKILYLLIRQLFF